jgi:hypothetical protein
MRWSESPDTYVPAITGELVLRGSDDRAGGRLDQPGDERLRSAAGADRDMGIAERLVSVAAVDTWPE